MQVSTFNVPSLQLNSSAPNPYYSLDWLLDPSTDDIVINPDGTYALASGSLKLQQDIKLFLLSPPGTSLQDSNWGNKTINMIGTAPSDSNALTATITAAVAALKYYKDLEQQTRGFPLEGSELISSIEVVSIVQDQVGGNSFTVTISCTDGTGGTSNLNVQLSQ